jgi:hypothetical protein
LRRNRCIAVDDDVALLGRPATTAGEAAEERDATGREPTGRTDRYASETPAAARRSTKPTNVRAIAFVVVVVGK